MPNIHSAEFDESRSQPGFICRRARIGRQVGSERIGASLWELPPGEAAYPYHYHLAEEELLIVFSGRPSLRTPDGWRELEEGEVVSFPVGDGGAHQIVNKTDEPVRFLAVSNQQPDIVIRPDSNTLGAFERRPEGGGLYKHFRLDEAIDYFEGESR
ncbi:MAG: cupin domain-containing protein [Solirubrobacterales bacterium]